MSAFDSRILVLGGTAFIGRSFCETLRDKHGLPFTLLNRGVTNPDLFPGMQRIQCDRNNAAECEARLSGSAWDFIVDFTGHEDHHIRNILRHCHCEHYTFFSSSTVDLSWPTDALFSMAQNKLWCENLLQRYVKNLLIVRPGFVCGQHDYTGRFEEVDGMWCMKGTTNPVFPMIRVELLSNLVARLVKERRTGIVRAGYHAPLR